jgi:putative transposase
MYAFVEEQRGGFRIEPVCKVLQITPSAYRRRTARRCNPCFGSQRAQRDAQLIPKIEQVWNANFRVYGADKVWKQMNREGIQGGQVHRRETDAPARPAWCGARQGGTNHGA